MAELTDDQWDEFVEAIGDNTEATQILAENLKGASKTAGDSLNSLGDNADDLADDFDSMNNEVRDATDELEQFTETSNKLESAWKDVLKISNGIVTAFGNTTEQILANGESFGVMKQFIDPMADAAGMVVKGLGEVAALGVGLGASIPLVGGGAAVAAESLRGLSKMAAEVITKLIKFGSNLVIDGIEQLWSMFEGAASAGVLFTNGLHEMNEQRGNLSLTTQEYTEVVKGNRDQLSVFGGSVGEGAKRLSEVGKESKVFNEELRAMGITYKEQAENTSDFMASLQRSGQLRLMNDKQIAEASAEYQRNLAVMSSLTGKSIDTLKQEREESLKNMAFQAKLAKMDPAVRAEMEEALTSMPAGMKQAFQESVIFGNVMTDTGAIVSGAAEYIEKFANSVANGEASNAEAFQAFRDDLKANAPRLRENLSDLAAAGMAELLGNGNAVTSSINTFSDSLYKEISRAENTAKGTVERMESTGSKQEESVKQILAGLDAQRQMQDKMLQLIEDEALPIATKMFQRISEVMNEQLGKFVGWIKDPNSITDDARKKMNEVMSNLGVDGVLDSIDATLDEMLIGLGIKEAPSTKGFAEDTIYDATGQRQDQIRTTQAVEIMADGKPLHQMDLMGVFGDDFRNNLENSKRLEAQATSNFADRKIAAMEAEIEKLQALVGTKNEDTSTGFFDNKTTVSEIDRLTAMIERFEEQQKIANEELKKANKQREAGNRKLDEAIN